MKYLAAYLLLVQGGNSAPSVSDIKKLVESVGIEAEEARISALLASFEGKGSVDEIIAEGRTKLASVPSGCTTASSASGAVSSAAAEAVEEKEEEKEESDDDMGFGLFD